MILEMYDRELEEEIDRLDLEIDKQARTIEKLVEALEAVVKLEDPGDIEIVSIEAREAFTHARKAIAEAKG